MDDVLAKVDVPRRRFTVDEYYRMGEAGVFGPEKRVELIDGEIIAMAPIGNRHAACVARLTRALSRAVGDVALVWPQGNPTRPPPRSVPQPDVALLRARADDYARSSARPEDILLLVEVADTTDRYDRRVKLPLYARSGLAEVWIVDLTRDVVEVYRRPAREAYEVSTRVERGNTLTIAAFPDVVLGVDELLPPA
jgi:hypothetical protein